MRESEPIPFRTLFMSAQRFRKRFAMSFIKLIFCVALHLQHILSFLRNNIIKITGDH
jgi:hypothetical protein